MDIWVSLERLQTKINGELKNAGSPFYVRINDYNYSTKAFEYKLGRRDSLSTQEKGKAEAMRIILKQFEIWRNLRLFNILS